MAMTVKNSHSVESLSKKVGMGDPEVTQQFEDFFLENWSRLYSLLLRLVGDHAEAEDLALEAFMRLYQHAPQEQLFASGNNFNAGGWLRRVATNLGLNTLRAWKRRQRYELEAGVEGLAEQNEDNPAEIFAVREQRQKVRQILAKMKPRQAQILVLRHSGLSYQEIAASLGVAPTSIGPMLFRAETEFAKRYRATYPEGG